MLAAGLSQRADFRDAAHVRQERFGDGDAAVGVLVVFEDGDEGAANGEAGAVQGVDGLRFFAVFRALARLQSPRLEVGAVAA